MGYDEELLRKIQELKKKRNAYILAHGFQPQSVQEVADHVGGLEDMLRTARERGEKVLVVAGVYFMAELVAALTDKAVLIPDPGARCPMVNMLNLDKLREVKNTHPGVKIAAYIKSPPEGIALSHYCWTYERAQELLGKAGDEVLLIPDIHAGQNIALELKRKISLMGGYCPPHVKILAKDVKKLMETHPGAEVLAHPQCRGEVVKLAHRVLSSGGMLRYVKASGEQEFIVASELDLVRRLARENPGKIIHPASSRAICHNMKHHDQGKIYWSLRDMVHRVRITRNTSEKIRPLLEETLGPC